MWEHFWLAVREKRGDDYPSWCHLSDEKSKAIHQNGSFSTYNVLLGFWECHKWSYHVNGRICFHIQWFEGTDVHTDAV